VSLNVCMAKRFPLVHDESGNVMLNAGCGKHHLPGWVNLDFEKSDGIQACDLRAGIPYPNNTFDAVYSSHMIEHLSRDAGGRFVQEVFRVLKPGGVVRLLTPDLERMAREYLKNLEAYDGADSVENRQRYEWIMLELFDQMTREKSGGMMEQSIRSGDVCREYVLERTGDELRGYFEAPRVATRTSRRGPRIVKAVGSAIRIFCDRWRPGSSVRTGELHRWYYDRVSLKRTLEGAGFAEYAVVDHRTSSIAGWERANLDVSASGIGPRKPDSVIVEAKKPSRPL
jgi:predicted SAM-dependent methyltransferase